MSGVNRFRRFDLGNKAIEGIFDRSLAGAIDLLVDPVVAECSIKPPSFPVHTLTGSIAAAVTIASVTLMAVLVISELVAYIKVDTSSQMAVSDFHEHEAVSVRLRATFPFIDCKDLEVVADNPWGGSKNSGAVAVDRRPATRSESKPFQRKGKGKSSGCTLDGAVEVERAAGSLVLHVTHHDPARFVSMGGLPMVLKGESRSGPRGVAGPNITHIIHDLSFGPPNSVGEAKIPLPGRTFVPEGGSGMAKYSLKVVPISHRRVYGGEAKSYTYSANVGFVTESEMVVGSLILGVEFAYDFSPVMVRYTDTRKSLLEFITSVCAIVGGVHTVSGLFVRGLHGIWRKKRD